MSLQLPAGLLSPQKTMSSVIDEQSALLTPELRRPGYKTRYGNRTHPGQTLIPRTRAVHHARGKLPAAKIGVSGLTFPAPDTVALRFRVSVVLLPGELKLASVLQQAAAGQSAAASSISGGEILAGEFEAELRAPIFHHDDPSRCRASVFADLRRGVWADSPPPTSPPGALRLVYDACFSDWLTHATSLLQAPLDLPLSPTLSLVGQNLGSVAVQEIRDFEVQAFAVPSPSGFESALAIAFDVMPGCHGIVEDVQHFIGPSGFGVINDEFVVASVFQHQWHLGGFDRQCSFQSRTQAKVTRSGHEQLEDAIVFGHQDLLTLDNVAITTESNTRTDRLQFGGQGLLVPTTVRLVADGQSVTAAEAGLVPQPADWHGSAQLLPTLPPDPDPGVRDFQIKASKDGARHITQPFAYITDSDPRLVVTYVRIEGVTKQVLVLGDLNAPME